MMHEGERLQRAGTFIGRIQRPVGRRSRSGGHCGYTVLDARGVGLGFVRLNKRGYFTVYIYTDERGPDPEGRFKPQPKNTKDRSYKFAESDANGQDYALRALERTYDRRAG